MGAGRPSSAAGGEELTEHLRRIAPFLDALNCGAALVTRGGRIAYANPRLCEMMHRPQGELVGIHVHELYPAGQGREFVDSVLQHFDEPREAEFYLPRPDGSRLPVIVSGRRLDGVLYLPDCRLVTVIDISRQKQAQERYDQQYADIARLSDVVLEQALSLQDYSRSLEEKVRQRTRELHEANMDAIYMLAVASEARDADTGAHVLRIQHYVVLLARELGLSEAEAERMGYSSILHDVGKMVLPDEILKKPQALTPEQRAEMELHTVFGERILSDKPFFELARRIARSHHENWDGTGYPDRLTGPQIPLAARIVRLADVFDALLTPRVYKPPWPRERAIREILDGSGRHFDPEVVRAFRALEHRGAWQPPARLPARWPLIGWDAGPRREAPPVGGA